jgi:hypothetical protein
LAYEFFTEEQKREIRKTLGFLDIDEQTKENLKIIGFGLTIFGTLLTLILTFDDVLDRIRREF